MYHEERVIDGVLHWRGMPDGEWVAYTAAQLTERVANLKERCRMLAEGMAARVAEEIGA